MRRAGRPVASGCWGVRRSPGNASRATLSGASATLFRYDAKVGGWCRASSIVARMRGDSAGPSATQPP
eukprot:1109303-Pleurochrysis_carterae.AAC.1